MLYTTDTNAVITQSHPRIHIADCKIKSCYFISDFIVANSLSINLIKLMPAND